MTTTKNQALTLYTGADQFVASDGTPTVPNALLGIIDRLIGPSAADDAVGAVSNSTSENVVATLTVPAGAPATGSVYLIVAGGAMSFTSAETVTFRLRLGGVSGQTIATIQTVSGTMSTTAGTGNTSVSTTPRWKMIGEAVCGTPGASSVWRGGLTLENNFPSAIVANPAQVHSAGADISVDTTAAQDLVLTIQHSVANASNTHTRWYFYGHKVTGAGN